MKQLLQDSMTSALLHRHELLINDDDNKTPLYLQYFVLTCEKNEAFDKLCTLMRRFELVSVRERK